MKTFDKDPAATLDYVWDWNDWLNGDTIESHVITVPEGLTLESSSVAEGKVTVWLSGGVLHTTYIVGCKVTTNNVPPRIDERSAIFNLEDR